MATGGGGGGEAQEKMQALLFTDDRFLPSEYGWGLQGSVNGFGNVCQQKRTYEREAGHSVELKHQL